MQGPRRRRPRRNRCAVNAAATTSAPRSSACSPICPGPRRPGLQFSATMDSRYSSSPTLLKLVVMIVGVAMTVVALGALHVLDTADGMRHRRFLPPRWWSMPPAGRPGHRRAGVVALRRRQHLRRRLHPDDGPGVRARRLHGQLLPLVRHAGGAVRLVLRPAGAVGARQHQQRLGAAAHPGDGAGLLVGDQPRGDPATRPRRQDAAAPRRGPRRACSWRSGCR